MNEDELARLIQAYFDRVESFIDVADRGGPWPDPYDGAPRETARELARALLDAPSHPLLSEDDDG